MEFPKKYWTRKLSLGRLMFFLCFSDGNSHGTQRKGEPWNQQTVKGPGFVWLTLKHESAGFSRRLIFYTPSGAWYHFDIHFTVSRKYMTVAECFKAVKNIFSDEEN